MKKLQKIIIILVSVFTLNFAYTSVKAANGEQFYEGEWIPDIYINKVMNNGYKKYQQAQIIMDQLELLVKRILHMQMGAATFHSGRLHMLGLCNLKKFKKKL